MKISVLIPIKPDNGRRDLLWKHVKKRYQDLMPDLELCIGEDGSGSFNRSKAINRAAQKAHGEIFIITDADVVFNPSLVEQLIKNISKYPWIIPFKNGYRLNKKATDHLLEKGLKGIVKVKPGDYERIEGGLGALMNAMSRSSFEKVGGFDKRFKGWGFEDKAFYESLETLCGEHYRLDEDIYHLWHPTAPRDKEKLKKNKDLYFKYVAAKNNMTKMKRLIKERNK